jgi:hypothetical protein
MPLIYNEDDALAEWCGVVLGRKFAPPYRCIGVQRGSDLVGCALFNNFDPPNIEITFVTTTPRWATRQTIGRILRYPFIELDCRRLTAITGSMNRPTRAFLCRLGFKQEGFHPELFASDAGVSYGLLKQDAMRWLEDFHEQGTVSTDTARPLHDGVGGIEGQHPAGDSERPPE